MRDANGGPPLAWRSAALGLTVLLCIPLLAGALFPASYFLLQIARGVAGRGPLLLSDGAVGLLMLTPILVAPPAIALASLTRRVPLWGMCAGTVALAIRVLEGLRATGVLRLPPWLSGVDALLGGTAFCLLVAGVAVGVVRDVCLWRSIQMSEGVRALSAEAPVEPAHPADGPSGVG